MPPSAEACRAKAFECADLASKTIDTFSKLLLEKTAEHWHVLAETAKKYELTGSASPQMDEDSSPDPLPTGESSAHVQLI